MRSGRGSALPFFLRYLRPPPKELPFRRRPGYATPLIDPQPPLSGERNAPIFGQDLPAERTMNRLRSPSHARCFRLLPIHFASGLAIFALAFGPSLSRSDDYATIAAAVASPLPNSREKLKEAYTDPKVMLRVERARQILQSRTKVDSDLIAPRQNILDHLEACRRSLQEIRRLDPEFPDLETIALQTLAAAPEIIRKHSEAAAKGQKLPDPLDNLGETLVIEGINSFVDVWNASKERERYRESYRSARAESLALAAIAKKRSKGAQAASFGIGLAVTDTDDSIFVDEPLAGGPAAKAGLRHGDELVSVDGKQLKKTVDKRTIIDESVFATLRGPRGSAVKVTYARNGTLQTVQMARDFAVHTPLLELDFDGSWNATFAQDSLEIRNVSGVDLTNCTLLVTLDGVHGDTKKPKQIQHLHFVEIWPAEEWRYAWYRSSSAGGVAGDESVDRVQRVTVEILSDQYRDRVTHDYAGTAEYASDINRYVDLIKGNQKFELRVIDESFLSEAGIELQHSGAFRFIPQPKITVTLTRGKDVRKLTWPRNAKTWKAGYWSGHSLTDASFNGLKPSRVDVELEFPESSKTLSYQWDVPK